MNRGVAGRVLMPKTACKKSRVSVPLSRIKNRLEGPIAQKKTIKQKIPPWLNVTTQGPLSSMLENIAQNVFFLT
jgi:hypothetical protein